MLHLHHLIKVVFFFKVNYSDNPTRVEGEDGVIRSSSELQF